MPAAARPARSAAAMQRKTPADAGTYVGLFLAAMAVGFVSYNAARIASFHHFHLPMPGHLRTTQFFAHEGAPAMGPAAASLPAPWQRVLTGVGVHMQIQQRLRPWRRRGRR